jgi:tetratricopeptide (TPR) repeat protein
VQQLLESRAELRLRIDFLSRVAEAFTLTGRPDEASQIISLELLQLQKFNVEPIREAYLGQLAITLFVAGQSEEALVLIRQIKDLPRRVDYLSWSCYGLAQVGQRNVGLAEETLKTALQIANPASRAAALGSAAWALTLSGITTEATQALEQALSLAKPLEPQKHFYALRSLSTSLAQMGKTKEGLELARKLRGTVVLDEMVEVLARSGKLEDAMLVARESDSKYPNPYSFLRAADVLLQMGKHDEAGKFAIAALASAQRLPEEIGRPQALARVADVLTKSEMAPEAIVAAEDSLASGMFGWDDYEAVREAALALARAGRTEESLAAANKTKDIKQRATTIAELSVALADQGKRKDATRLAVIALADAEASNSELTQETACTKATIALARLHSYRSARRVADGCSNYVVFSDEKPKSEPGAIGPYHIIVNPRLEAYTAIFREYAVQHHPGIDRLFWRTPD